MNIIIKATNLKLTPALKQYIQEKINSLEKFVKRCYGSQYFNKFLGKRKAECEAWIEVGKETKGQLKGPIFFAECQIKFPGKSLRAKVKNKDLRLAVNEAKDDLQGELKQYKNKLRAQTERKARAAKKELKISPQARFYRKGRIREEGI